MAKKKKREVRELPSRDLAGSALARGRNGKGPHEDRRTKRNRTRGSQNARAVEEGRQDSRFSSSPGIS